MRQLNVLEEDRFNGHSPLRRDRDVQEGIVGSVYSRMLGLQSYVRLNNRYRTSDCRCSSYRFFRFDVHLCLDERRHANPQSHRTG